jgi:titin
MRTTKNLTARANTTGRRPPSLFKVLVAIATIALGVYTFAPPAFADATVPDPPTITAVNPGLNAVSVDISANSDGGDAITSYTVTCTSSDGGATQSASNASSPVTVNNLTNGNTYSCTAVATNGIGDSDPSDPSDDFVAITVPDAPTITGVTLGSNSANVSFTPNADGGDPISFYKVTCTSSTGGTTRSKTGTSSPITVTSLSNSRMYTCTVVANNSVGASSASAASSSFEAGSAPPAPHQPVITRGSDAASVAISPNGNGGSAITSYGATCTSSNGGTTQSNSNGSSPVVVSSLTDGKNYTCTATVTNSFGTSAASVASASFLTAVTPDAPSLTDVTRGQNSADVSFTANGTGGDPITGYTATCTSSDGGATESASGGASPLTVSNLTNGNTYTCNVVATNGIGDSSPSADSGSFVAATLPSAPSITTVNRSTNGGSVVFTSNGDGSDPISDYTATCTSSNGGTTRSASGATSPVNVSNLTNGKDYACTVVATNGIGDSAASVASGSFTAAAVPAAPTLNSLTRDPNGATVAFTANSDGGDSITGFTVTCTSSDGGATESASDVASPIEVDSLTNSNTYTCTVLATNSIGDGAPSTASAPFVAATAPDAPTLTGVTRGQNSVDVAFTANGDEGDPITGFTATCTSSNGGTTKSASGATSPITVGSLSNGKTYSCTVAATNSFGNSFDSNASSNFTAATVPAAPTIGAKSLISNGVSVGFSANGNGSDAITSFTATCVSSDGGTTQSGSGASSPVTVNNLTNGKTYTCTVVATNGIGDSAASAATSSFVAIGVADAPIITSVDLGANAVTVDFGPGADGGVTVTSYTVTCTSSDGGTTRSGTNATDPITVSTLTNGKTYACSVVATNPVGDSAASSSTGAFVAGTTPSAPTITGVTLGSNAAIVAFTPNADGGNPIEVYSAKCSSSNGGVSHVTLGESSPITVSNLTNGQTYTCKVTAINEIGSGAASAASSSFNAATFPQAPTMSGVTRGLNAAVVSFSANGNGGNAITGYTVTCTSSDGGTTQSASGASSPITVSSLSDGNTYTCTAVATNAVGDSPASAASSSIVAATTPDAPTIGAVSQGVNNATWRSHLAPTAATR